MRGEHGPLAQGAGPCEGSSPHARGAHGAPSGAGLRQGIIPACAGSTDAARYTTRRERDHPRMHGEHGPPVTRAQEAGGSSPHARGAPHERPRPDRAGGIIPACAGSTRGKHLFRLDTGDHPRMRGEHGATRQNLWSNPGSSPHARGALLAARRAARAVGIIPACAGSTLENQRQSLVYAYDSLTFARMQFDRRITESRKSRSAFLRTASPFGTCSHRSTPSKGGPQGWRHRFRWAEV